MPEAMVIEKWENAQREAGFEASAKRIGAFRRKYGDREVPFRASSRGRDLAYVELECELRGALPYMPEEAFATLVAGSYRLHGVPASDLAPRAEALIYAHYGTDIPLAKIENAFSAKRGRVEGIIDEHFDVLHRAYNPLGQTTKRNKFPLQKLDAKIPAPEIPPGEHIKGARDIWTYFRRLYLPEAKEIMDYVDKGKVVVVSAPRGSGKTFNLMRTAQLEAASRNYSALWKSFHLLSSTDSSKDILAELFRYEDSTLQGEPGSTDALIIDETQKMLAGPELGIFTASDPPERIYSRTEVAERFFTKLREKNGRAVLINAGINPAHRDYITKAFASAASSQGLDCVEHRMRQTQIPVELAVKHLNFLEADEETIKFVSNPENAAALSPRMFDNHTGFIRGLSLGEARERFLAGGGVPRWRELMQLCEGNSKAGMIRVLENLGVLTDEYSLREAMEIPDY